MNEGIGGLEMGQVEKGNEVEASSQKKLQEFLANTNHLSQSVEDINEKKLLEEDTTTYKRFYGHNPNEFLKNSGKAINDIQKSNEALKKLQANRGKTLPNRPNMQTYVPYPYRDTNILQDQKFMNQAMPQKEANVYEMYPNAVLDQALLEQNYEKPLAHPRDESIDQLYFREGRLSPLGQRIMGNKNASTKERAFGLDDETTRIFHTGKRILPRLEPKKEYQWYDPDYGRLRISKLELDVKPFSRPY